MARTKRASAASGTKSRIVTGATPANSYIVIQEPVQTGEQLPHYPWPSSMAKESYGNRNFKPSSAFSVLLNRVRKLRPKYQWIPLFQSRTGKNAIAEFPELLETLNNLFADQLQSRYNEAQHTLLIEADVILICYDPEADSILSYGSMRISDAGTIPSVPFKVIHFGHMIVAKGNEKQNLAPLTGVTIGLYGHTLLDLLRTEVVIMRTNNRYVERIFSRAPEVYRSDQLSNCEAEDRKQIVVEAVKWTDKHVFHSPDELQMGAPTKITHRFADTMTIDGVNNDEIIYLARISSIGLYALRILRSAINRL